MKRRRLSNFFAGHFGLIHDKGLLIGENMRGMNLACLIHQAMSGGLLATILRMRNGA